MTGDVYYSMGHHNHDDEFEDVQKMACLSECKTRAGEQPGRPKRIFEEVRRR